MVRHFEWSLSQYQRIERGDSDVKLSTLKRLADAFEVSLSELMEGVG